MIYSCPMVLSVPMQKAVSPLCSEAWKSLMQEKTRVHEQSLGPVRDLLLY